MTTLRSDKFDAAGRIIAEIDPAISKYYDGDGNLVRSYNEYYLFSKVLGGKHLSIISATGTKTETSVFGNGQLLARQEIVAGTGQVTFVHRDPHNTIDYTSTETKWVDAQGTTGKAATSTYISQYQAGMFGHPDPSTYVTNTGQFYPGGGGNQKPGQSTVCYEGYVKVSCSSLNNSIRMGGIVWMRVSSQSLTGYDEESSNLLSSANSSATSRNGKPTGNGGWAGTRRVKIIPGTSSGLKIDGEDFDTDKLAEPIYATEFVSVVSGGGILGTLQTTTPQVITDSISMTIRATFESACIEMGNIAQAIADQVYDAKRPGWSVKEFDKQFSELYIGKSIGPSILSALWFRGWAGGTNWLDTLRSNPNSIPLTADNTNRGEGGFKQEYRDTGEYPGANAEAIALNRDITHHITAYISGGTHSQGLAIAWHKWGDNAGDQRSGQAGWNFGSALRRNPTSLPKVGATFRARSCQ